MDGGEGALLKREGRGWRERFVSSGVCVLFLSDLNPILNPIRYRYRYYYYCRLCLPFTSQVL